MFKMIPEWLKNALLVYIVIQDFPRVGPRSPLFTGGYSIPPRLPGMTLLPQILYPPHATTLL